MGTTTPAEFATSCVLMIGEVQARRKDFEAFRRFMGQLGPRTFYATARGMPPSLSPPPMARLSDGTATSLRQDLDALIGQGCRDILFFISGHGAAAPGAKVTNAKLTRAQRRNVPRSRVAQVSITPRDARRPRALTVTALKRVLTDLAGGGTSFNFKIDANFSGRFVTALNPERGPNLGRVVLVEASSRATQFSGRPIDVPDLLRNVAATVPASTSGAFVDISGGRSQTRSTSPNSCTPTSRPCARSPD